MYKLSDVAKKLNVEKVLIFEMLLTKGEYLEGNVIKKYGVTYLSDKGIEIIDNIIRGIEVVLPEKIESDIEDDEKEDALEKKESNENSSNENRSEKNIDFSHEIVIDENTDKIDSKLLKFESSDSEFKNECKIDDVKNLEVLTNKSKFLKFEKEEKRNRISKLRNEFILLDSEIRRKQEALESYDKILEEDIQWVSLLEDKLSIKLKEKLSKEDNEVNQKKIRDKMFF